MLSAIERERSFQQVNMDNSPVRLASGTLDQTARLHGGENVVDLRFQKLRLRAKLRGGDWGATLLLTAVQ